MFSLKILTVVALIIGLIIGGIIGYGISYTSAPGVKTITMISTTTVTAPVTVKEYVIGMPADLTGEGADYGIEVRDAGLLTIDEINKFMSDNGIPVRFRLEIEDSKTTVEGAVAAVQSLGGKGIKVIVGHLWSGQLNGIKSYVDSNKIFTVSVSSTSPALSIPNDYIFRMQAPDSIQGKVLAHLIWESGYKKVAVIYRNDPYGSGVFEYFNKEFSNLGGTVKSLAYTPDQPDYSSEVLQLSTMVKGLGADKETAVLIVAFNYEAIKMFDKARLDPTLSNTVWFSSESLKGPGILPPASPPEIAAFLAKVKLTGTYPASLTETALMKEFNIKFKNKYGREPKAYGAYTYDALWLVALSLALTNKYDGDSVRSMYMLLASRYVGATGPTALDENGDRALQDYQIWQVVKTDSGYDFKIIGGWDGTTNKLTIYG
jgi:branched-chain amino acid transport system substrate-binding protein